MSEYTVPVLESGYVTHDVKRIVVSRPDGYDFHPGEATEMSINRPGLREEKRPFTFTGLNDWPYLEFLIKIYRGHGGITAELEKLHAGDEIIIGDPWGAIHYGGKGVFIAGGAGITPFIAILRQLRAEKHVAGNTLLFSNKCAADIILKNELETMPGLHVHHVLTREKNIGFRDKRIDEDFLKETIGNFDQQFYLCGPDQFVEDIRTSLEKLGAEASSLVFEA